MSLYLPSVLILGTMWRFGERKVEVMSVRLLFPVDHVAAVLVVAITALCYQPSLGNSPMIGIRPSIKDPGLKDPYEYL